MTMQKVGLLMHALITHSKFLDFEISRKTHNVSVRFRHQHLSFLVCFYANDSSDAQILNLSSNHSGEDSPFLEFFIILRLLLSTSVNNYKTLCYNWMLMWMPVWAVVRLLSQCLSIAVQQKQVVVELSVALRY